MALIVHWLSQADRVGLQSGNTSYSDLARNWLEQLIESQSTSVIDESEGATDKSCWSTIEKFFDYLAAMESIGRARVSFGIFPFTEEAEKR